jgi:hypothetical protein
VIEDLQQRARLEAINVSEAPGDSPLVCYVHFDQQRLRMSSRLAAFQLFAAQILFAKRNNQSFIDATSVLMSDHGTGQRNASANELLALIQVFVKHLTSCYFVVDGLDECSEWEELLRSLKHCIQHSNCQIVIFTRPHIPYHRVIESDAFSLELRGDENIEDIKMFLRGPISELSESGKIGNVSEEYVVTALATQANSIFLWAVLIVAYLQQPGSTPRERLDIINGNISFLGLENLYSRILEDLAGRVPKTHLVKVRKVFQWLIASKEPWTHEMLRTALAVQDNRPSTQGDFITDFTKSMLELCGPLIEFRPDWTIRFIHLSVAEYLTSPNEESQQSGFHLPINIAHCSMANLSLAYLMHEIPRHPLSGNPWITASHNIVSRKHILLPYVAKHWPDHVCRSLEFREGLEEEYKVHMVGRNCLAVLESFLRKLLEDKEVVTAWIEASWTFGTPPSILDLADRAKECSNLDDQRLKGKFISLSETLTRLASSLARLNKDWGHVLVTEPNEIWQPSIAAFSKSQFLVGTTEADLSSLSSDADNGSVVIASQVSCNGKEVGVLKVWPTRYVEVIRFEGKSLISHVLILAFVAALQERRTPIIRKKSGKCLTRSGHWKQNCR